jgi:hypothetical protein
MEAPKFIPAITALVFSFSAYCQQHSSNHDKRYNGISTWGTYPKTNLVTDSSRGNGQAPATNFQNFPSPNFGNYYIPVIGNYTSSENNLTRTITISGDEKNIGKVWIAGLAPVKIYALLKAVPGLYKIPLQTQNEKQVLEGTLIYDEVNKQVSICVGCGFKEEKRFETAADNYTPLKNKNILSFTGVKTNRGTAATD